MAELDDPRRPVLDGALPLAALLAAALLIAPLHAAAYGLAALYLVFAAGMATSGSDRPGEPDLPWRLYALGAGFLAIAVPAGGIDDALKPLVAAPLALIAAGLVIHVCVKGRHGIRRVGLLSAFGRREHDARIGRTLEAMAVALAVATAGTGPAAAGLYAVAGWLLAAASVAERGPAGSTSAREDQPPAAAPAPAA
jgi:hypothetical protein